VRNPHLADKDKDSCYAVFATDNLGFSPEWFSRIGGELYLAGLNSTMIPLPELATDVKVGTEAMSKMRNCAKDMIALTGGKDMEVLRESVVRVQHEQSQITDTNHQCSVSAQLQEVDDLLYAASPTTNSAVSKHAPAPKAVSF
jgi:hypothetical protein